MKINKFQNSPVLNKKSKDSDKKIDSKTPVESSGVKIEISNSAKELVNRISKHENTGYSKKVEEIRKSVMDGSYAVDPGKIADKMLETILNEKGSVK